jgi:NAD dependent epimerase/dehydratase family enzyme
VSWVAIDDAVAAILHAVRTRSVHGPVNVVAPDPVTNREFAETLGRVIGRAAGTGMPAFAARLLLGEMVDEVILPSIRVRPTRLLETRFTFRHPRLEDALRALLGDAAGAG